MDSRLTGLELSAPLEISDGFIRKATEKGPVIVAHSVMSTQTNRVFHESKKTKAQFGDAVTLIGGGPHASARPSELLDAGFDHVVIGEGEKLVTDLLWYLLNDKDPREIDGVVSEKRDSYPKPKGLPRVELDEYPPFALDMNVLGPIEVTR
ncbi:MAG: cobalamin-dependent protein, partial [Promethearchaeota archaeon]